MPNQVYNDTIDTFKSILLTFVYWFFLDGIKSYPYFQ